MSPLQHENEEERPLIRGLLSVPHLRARYLAHVRTITEEWLNWDVLGPVAASYRALLGDEIEKDVKKLYATAAYAKSIEGDYDGGRRPVPGIRRFVSERRKAILSHPELKKPHPAIASVHAVWSSESPKRGPMAANPVTIAARVEGQVKPATVLLYHAAGSRVPFTSLAMHDDGSHRDGAAGDGVYAADIPGSVAGTPVRYYVEARSGADLGTTVFFPTGAEGAALTYRVRAPTAPESAVRIAKLMAGNKSGPVDPQGDHDDWIKLHNHSGVEVVLSGMYLSDDEDKPRKWKFPTGATIVPGGYLVVWADESSKDRPGLHANFKLSRKGETVLLVDSDERGNAILDRVAFAQQEEDVALDRER